jgi:hypothetical protein
MLRNTRLKRTAGAIFLLSLPATYSSPLRADETAITIQAEDLLQLMQFEGLISKEQAEKAKNIAKDRASRESQAPVEFTSQENKDKPAATEPGVTRVPYIPQYLKDEIRDEVRMGLKEDVVDDVMAQAKTESWGVPGTNPDWTKRIKFKGDIRFRYQAERFADGNSTQYRNFNAINAAGGTTAAGVNAFINTTEDRDRLRLRARLGMDAKVTQGVTASMRIATGDPDDPVSTNQTLGNYGGDYQLSLDQAFIRFNPVANEYQLTFGRMPSPWMSPTQLVWDDDLNFDGVAFSYYFNRGNDMYDDEQQFDPYLTVGAFPLQEVQLSGNDKWLYGAQVGFSYLTRKQNQFKMGLAYYYFDNISGVKNAPDSTLTNYTAPPFVQKGNTMFDISNSTTDPQTELWALAADYQELNLSAIYDMANFAPVHVIFTGEYVENIGYDQGEMQARAGESVAGKTTGYDFGIKVGWPTVVQPGNWNAGLNYRYLERDAVVDAFTDSDFHLGGTDGQGYKLSFSYGIEENTWLQLRVISANEIDGPPLGVMTVLADLNAKF